MRQSTASSTNPLTKKQFTRVVNEALVENGEQAKAADEISEVYDFYKRLWEEEGGHGKLEMVNFNGKLQLAFG